MDILIGAAKNKKLTTTDDSVFPSFVFSFKIFSVLFDTTSLLLYRRRRPPGLVQIEFPTHLPIQPTTTTLTTRPG